MSDPRKHVAGSEPVGTAAPSTATGRFRREAVYEASIVLFWAGQHVCAPFLPVYARAQGASLSLVGVVIASYGLVQALLRLPLGVASDRMRRRKPFVLLGYASVLLSALGLWWSPRPEFLLLFRALGGVGASTWAMTVALFASFGARGEAQRRAGLAASLHQLGLVGAYVLGAVVAGAFGLSAPFVAGAVLAGLALLLVSRAPEEVAADTEPVGLAQLGRTIASRQLLLVSLLGALTMYVNQTVNGFLPLSAQEVGASTAQLGWLVAGGQAASTLTAFLASRLTGRWKERNVVAGTLLCLAVALAGMSRCTTLIALALVRLAYGLGYGFLYPTLMGLSVKTVAPEERASAMSVFTAVYAVGMFAGPSISGVVAERLGLSGMFTLTGAVGLLAMMLALASIPTDD